MEMTLEVLVVPVSDVERSKDFYAGKLGFNVDTDAQLTDDFLVVRDVRAARDELARRGVEVSEVQVIAGGPPRPAGPDDQLDYQGFAFFEDPDGNARAIQQLSQPLADRASALAEQERPRRAPDPA